MLKNLGRATSSFLLVLLAFGVYSFAVVPLVEREASSSESVKKVVAIAQLAAGRTATDRYVRELSELGFPANSWELQKPTVLRSPQMTILLKDFTQQSDGSLHIRPCTLVHYPTGRDDHDRKRGPTIMRAPDGAILYFDRKIDLKTFSFDAKIAGGKLVGDIQIISVGGKDSEDFQLVTRDVEILDKRIFTRELVKLQMGKTYMQGRELTLTRNQDVRDESPDTRSVGSVAGSDSVADKSSKAKEDKDGFDWMSELSHLSLRQLDVLRVETEDGELFKSFANRPAAKEVDDVAVSNSDAMQKKTPTIMEVACSGPIHFDLRDLVATVEDNVTITHQVQNKPVDTLRAEQLSLHFVRQSKSQQNETRSQSGGSSSAKGGKVILEGKGDSGLALNRIVAFGRPLVIDAKSEGAYVETRHLEHNFASNRIKLRSYNPFAPRPNINLAKPVVIRNEDHQISAPALSR